MSTKCIPERGYEKQAHTVISQQDALIIIIIEVFLKHKVLSVETVLSACAHTHTHTHTHRHLHSQKYFRSCSQGLQIVCTCQLYVNNILPNGFRQRRLPFVCVCVCVYLCVCVCVCVRACVTVRDR